MTVLELAHCNQPAKTLLHESWGNKKSAVLTTRVPIYGVSALVDRDEVLDLRNARGRPGSMLGFFPLRPEADLTAKRHFAVGRLHLNVVGTGPCVTFQRVFDFEPHIDGPDFRCDCNIAENRLHAL